MKILISEFMDLPAVERLREKFEVRYEPDLVDRRADFLAALADFTALIVRNRTQVDAETIAAAPKLRVVGRLGVGLDNIDMAACAARGIEVHPAYGANALSVAEYVVAMTMVLLRGAYLASAQTAGGTWLKQALGAGRETSGKTLGLVGFGDIARVTAKLAQGVGLRVIGHHHRLDGADPVWAAHGVVPRGLDELLAEADVVSLHQPLTDATRGSFDEARLRRMKRGAVLVNTARGGIVDEAALAALLMEGYLGGAAVDVFAEEPLPAGSPFAAALAAGAPLILTPHIGGVTAESNQRVSNMIADRVSESLAQLH